MDIWPPFLNVVRRWCKTIIIEIENETFYYKIWRILQRVYLVLWFHCDFVEKIAILNENLKRKKNSIWICISKKITILKLGMKCTFKSQCIKFFLKIFRKLCFCIPIFQSNNTFHGCVLFKFFFLFETHLLKLLFFLIKNICFQTTKPNGHKITCDCSSYRINGTNLRS